MEDGPSFPPLFRGEAASPGVDPFAKAIAAAIIGTDPGLIVHQLEPERLRAAIVLAPEAPLEDAMAMVFAAALGFADAFGALAPPEVGMHMDWPGGLRVNGAKCGQLHASASDPTPDREPAWLVIGLDLPIFPTNAADEPGHTPDVTTLIEEGCAEVAPTELLEHWSRHMLVWINTWLDEGIAPLHAEWRARAHALGEEIALTLQGNTHTGTFVGLDEKGGLLLRNGDQTSVLPLTAMLEMR